MKKILTFIFVLIISITLNSCNSVYRILTTDDNHQPINLHKYELVNTTTGEIIIVYDINYYKPGTYIELGKDSLIFQSIKPINY